MIIQENNSILGHLYLLVGEISQIEENSSLQKRCLWNFENLHLFVIITSFILKNFESKLITKMSSSKVILPVKKWVK